MLLLAILSNNINNNKKYLIKKSSSLKWTAFFELGSSNDCHFEPPYKGRPLFKWR